MKYLIIVPTLNAEPDWPRFAPAILACANPNHVLIVDSDSTDNTVQLAADAGFRMTSIARSDFNHGGTRQWAASCDQYADVLVYLTQDAILADSSALERLLAPFEDPAIGAVFGRQLPRPGAGAIETHARLFNYPPKSDVRTLATRESTGFKSIFLSNSFAAYRRTALEGVGGFPTDVILGEDTVTAARLLLVGWKIAYAADACVYHSHAYSSMEEFKRYFDTGVLHSRESWLLKEFGRTNGEGRRFVKSEMNYLRSRNPWLIPEALTRTVVKYAGYRLGRMEARFGVGLKRRLSMHSFFWKSSR
jgi:rhamnosyltransferase